MATSAGIGGYGGDNYYSELMRRQQEHLNRMLQDQRYQQQYPPQRANPSWGISVPRTPSVKKNTAKKVPAAKPKVTFDSVIVPDRDKQAILSAIDQVNNHELIFDKWGFSSVFEKGTAISMLFYGVPGTGKTLMAQAIADKLGKKLKVIGNAEVQSSEPGGAERAIKGFFEGAKSDTVLLFDECDSLIYDRSQVGSILAAQVNQLLSSLEKFTGIVIFTTNRLGHLDEAFNRRLSLKLEFQLPDKKARLDIWKRMFPKKAPLNKNIDWDLLSDFEISGGYIKNAVLRAARAAASAKAKKIGMEHLGPALKAEIESMIEFDNAKVNLPRQTGGMSMGRDHKLTVDKTMGAS